MCGDALQLESESMMAHCICGQICGWQVKRCDPALTRAIPIALERSIAHIIKQMSCFLP